MKMIEKIGQTLTAKALTVMPEQKLTADDLQKTMIRLMEASKRRARKHLKARK